MFICVWLEVYCLRISDWQNKFIERWFNIILLSVFNLFERSSFQRSLKPHPKAISGKGVLWRCSCSKCCSCYTVIRAATAGYRFYPFLQDYELIYVCWFYFCGAILELPLFSTGLSLNIWLIQIPCQIFHSFYFIFGYIEKVRLKHYAICIIPEILYEKRNWKLAYQCLYRYFQVLRKYTL